MKMVKPPYLHTTIPKYRCHLNPIINLDQVCRITKWRESWYPDNEGIPAIRFFFASRNDDCDWYFDQWDEKLRNEVFEAIGDGIYQGQKHDQD